jgi:hypothetical protein
MSPQHFGPLGLRAEFGHHPVPQRPSCAQLGNLHEKIHANGKEKRQPTREFVDIHPGLSRGADVFAPVGQRIGQLLHQVRPGLLHVIARD